MITLNILDKFLYREGGITHIEQLRIYEIDYLYQVSSVEVG